MNTHPARSDTQKLAATVPTITSASTNDRLSDFFRKHFGGDRTEVGKNTDSLSRTHYVLADTTSLFEDMGTVFNNVVNDRLLWVNRDDFMPSKFTDAIEHRFTEVNFGQHVFPELTPAESVSRTFAIKRRTMKQYSKRAGLEFEFELDRMMTKEGRDDFSLFTTKIANSFKNYIAWVSVTEFLTPNNMDLKWYQKYGAVTGQQWLRKMDEEIKDFAAFNKSKQDAEAIIVKYANALEQEHEQYPNIVIVDPRKTTVLSDPHKDSTIPRSYDARGEVAVIRSLSVRAFPMFPTSVTEESVNPMDMEVCIGNYFEIRGERYLDVDPKDYSTGGYRTTKIYSEVGDGEMVDIRLVEILRNCGRWAEDGWLHDDHFKFFQNSRYDRDMFTYYSETLQGQRVCDVIGDMEPENLPLEWIRAMAATALRGYAGGAVGAAGAGALKTHLMARLGKDLNPIFREFNTNVGITAVGRPAANASDPSFQRLRETDDAFQEAIATLDAHGILTSKWTETVAKLKRVVEEIEDEEEVLKEDANLVQYRRLMGIASRFAQFVKDNIDDEAALSTMVAAVGDQLDAIANEIAAGRNVVGAVNALNGLIPAAVGELPLGADAEDKYEKTTATAPLRRLGNRDVFRRGRRGGGGEAKRHRRFADKDDSPFFYERDSMGLNIQKVVDFFEGDMLAAALAVLTTPIHRDVFENMLLHDIHIPMDFIVFRPRMTYRMTGMAVALSGYAMGETMVGHGNTGVAWTIKNKTGSLHTTMWVAAVLKQPSRRIIVPCVCYDRCLGGGKHDFFTEDEWQAFANEQFMTQEENGPSLIAVAIAPGSRVKKEFVDLRGNTLRAGDVGDHYLTAGYNRFHYRFDEMTPLMQRSYEKDGLGKCVSLMYQGTQMCVGARKGVYDITIENRGHHGFERPGHVAIRNGGTKHKDPRIPLTC